MVFDSIETLFVSKILFEMVFDGIGILLFIRVIPFEKIS